MKSIEISRELFDNVFEGCVFNYVKDNVIHYSQPCVIMEGSWVESETNINDFFFDCLDWTKNHNVFIVTYPLGKKEYDFIIFNLEDTQFEKPLFQGYHKESIQQAIFDACEYVLKELNESSNTTSK